MVHVGDIEKTRNAGLGRKRLLLKGNLVMAAALATAALWGMPQLGPALADHDEELPVFVMDSTPVTACDGIFTDTGGLGGLYMNNEDIVKTFYPSDTTNKKLRFQFTQFDIEESPEAPFLPDDQMWIYDGNSTSAPLIGHYFPRSDGTGSIPGTIRSTATDGSLTFRWKSDEQISGVGWAAEFACVRAYKLPFAASGLSIWGL